MAGIRIAVALLLVCGALVPVSAQSKKAAAAPRKPPPAPKPPPAKRSEGNPAKELDQFSRMSPEEREKALSKLPPQRRAAVEQRFNRYQKMTPEQQQRFKQELGLCLPPNAGKPSTATRSKRISLPTNRNSSGNRSAAVVRRICSSPSPSSLLRPAPGSPQTDPRQCRNPRPRKSGRSRLY